MTGGDSAGSIPGTDGGEMAIDHAGIATDDAETLVDLYSDLLDCPVAHEERFDGMQVVFLDLGNGYFELLEPVDSEGAIARYLDDSGPGIHHLAVATADIEGALDAAREAGVEPIDETPRPGAWGHDVAFLHPRSTGGVLLEFVEH
jgi:methylmalonyl-CoA/ethylmalonyl-CoA epimerase